MPIQKPISTERAKSPENPNRAKRARLKQKPNLR